MIYQISNESLTAAVDSLGGQLVSLKGKDHFQYLWSGDPRYWAGQAPVLFPIVGALRNGRAKIGGEWHEMGQHGFARRREFEAAEQGKDWIALTLGSDEETKKAYPFDFSLTVTYRLAGNGIKTAFSVENRGEGPMPFAIGGHPGFNLPIDEAARFEDYTLCFECPEDQKCPAIVEGQALIDPEGCAFVLENESEIPLRHSLFYHDALIFEGLRSKKVQIKNKKTGKGLEMDFSGFPMLGVWSAKNDGPYVCLEPWTGCATLTVEGDDFERKKGMTLLAPGERADFAFTVTVL